MATALSPMALLAHGRVALKGRMPRSSNATFLVEVTTDGRAALAVYKPGRGERPLWDFPPGLYLREIAAYHLSEALGWGLVPPTVLREGPLGEGSLQLFVAADFAQHYFTLREDPAQGMALRRICAFDVVANNADRKSGHCLRGPDDRLHAVDHGLSFHVEPKLRTVIWDFAGEPLPPAIRADLGRLVRAGLSEALTACLDAEEAQALVHRARALVEAGRFPPDPGGRAYPWPLV
jgi:uncharacterized repeat protein (TIGR03843 family)